MQESCKVVWKNRKRLTTGESFSYLAFMRSLILSMSFQILALLSL